MIKIGVIGYGYWGPNLVRNFLSIPSCEITKIAEIKSENLKELRKHYPTIKTVTNADEVIEDKKIDAVIGHHPVGISLLALNEVMDLQVNAYADVGVPINVMDALMRERSEDVKRKIHPSNHNQIIDTARLLEVPLMNLHTAWDNLGDNFMTDYLKKRKFDTVSEIVDYMIELPEY